VGAKMQVGQTRATCENASKFSNQAAAQVPGKAPINEEMLNKTLNVGAQNGAIWSYVP